MQDIADLNNLARKVLEMNCRDGLYTVPSDSLYPFQWNWDSCLSALGWACFNEDRAWTEVQTLFEGQWSSGKVPHIIFHQDVDTYFPGPEIWDVTNDVNSSGITQPPIAATCIRMMYEKAKDKELARDKACSLLLKVFKYHRWFHEERDPHNTGLVAIYHPWESGRDNSAEWDLPLGRVPVNNLMPYKRIDIEHVDPSQRPTNEEYDRYIALVQFFVEHKYDHKRLYELVPFKVADIGVNSILLRANKDLLWLMQELGGAKEPIDIVLSWIKGQEQAFEALWCDKLGAYLSLDLISNKHLEFMTSAAFLPLFALMSRGARQQNLINHLTALADEVPFLVPSLIPVSDQFNSKRYWRGPTWAIINFLIADGLKHGGDDELADRIGRDTALLIQSSGFKEYYDPLTGEGLGGDDFSWTASMWLTWASHFATHDHSCALSA